MSHYYIQYTLAAAGPGYGTVAGGGNSNDVKCATMGRSPAGPSSVEGGCESPVGRCIVGKCIGGGCVLFIAGEHAGDS